MKTLIISAALAAISTAAMSQPSTPQCAERSSVIVMLEERYGEIRLGYGLTSDGFALEVFVSSETGTFTVTTTNANGVTCIRAYGESFQVLTEFLNPAKGDQL